MTKLCALTLLLLALSACSSEQPASKPSPAAAAADDNDTAEPVAEPKSDEKPHDKSVPHDH